MPYCSCPDHKSLAEGGCPNPDCILFREPSPPSTGSRAAALLEGVTARLREADAEYKGSDKLYADVMAVLFPEGVALKSSHDHQRFHIFMLAMVKVTRYARNWKDGHDDSLTDLAAYAAMLQAIDRASKKSGRPVAQRGTAPGGYRDPGPDADN